MSASRIATRLTYQVGLAHDVVVAVVAVDSGRHAVAKWFPPPRSRIRGSRPVRHQAVHGVPRLVSFSRLSSSSLLDLVRLAPWRFIVGSRPRNPSLFRVILRKKTPRAPIFVPPLGSGPTYQVPAALLVIRCQSDREPRADPIFLSRGR